MELLPGGTEPPSDIPREAFDAALAAYEEQRKLDMGALAQELGVSRATLYRRAGSGQRLLGAVLWYRSRQVLHAALQATAQLRGAARVVAITEGYLRAIHDRPQLIALLDRDPDGALRVLTSSESPVNAGLRAVIEKVLAEEEASGALELTIDRETLAYVIVRIGEALLYADRPRGAGAPDHQRVVGVIARLLAGSQVGALAPPQEARETTAALSREAS
jgi:AcrR family transcriptional regulator